MSNNNETTTQEEYSTIWSMKEHHTLEAFEVAKDRWTVQVQWSDKLGLRHKRCDLNEAQAKELAIVVQANGLINTPHWNKIFNKSVMGLKLKTDVLDIEY